MVSVIMPARNAATFIGRAIQSVHAQTYPHWEIVVTDDGSDDATGGLAASLNARVVVHLLSLGAAAARNSAIQASTGSIIAFLDADDVWEPEFLRTAVDALSTADLFCGNGRYIDADGHPGAQIFMRSPLRSSAEQTWRKMVRVSFLCPSQVAVRRQWLPRPLPFDPPASPAEDWDLWLTLLGRGARVAYDPRPLMGYRVHSANTSTRAALHQAAQRYVMRKQYRLARLPAEKKIILRTLARLEVNRVLSLDGFTLHEVNVLWWALRRDPLALYRLLLEPQVRSMVRAGIDRVQRRT